MLFSSGIAVVTDACIFTIVATTKNVPERSCYYIDLSAPKLVCCKEALLVIFYDGASTHTNSIGCAGHKIGRT